METLIIAIRTAAARLDEMKIAVAEQTGDADPFFCPQVKEGQPYEGHAHTFPPMAASNASAEPIELK